MFSILNLIAMVSIFVTMLSLRAVNGNFQPSAWKSGHATFYADESASETMEGACGYRNLFNNGLGTAIAALSTVMFNNGARGDACSSFRCFCRWTSTGVRYPTKSK
ncbi:expansin-A7-like isoform X2 [Silene latifolia]|uniref:expansin-A7-like isoform X2 n=1 Tax=Silene latifolia TaxID=37657 RepID=UPI003D789B6E